MREERGTAVVFVTKLTELSGVPRFATDLAWWAEAALAQRDRVGRPY